MFLFFFFFLPLPVPSPPTCLLHDVKRLFSTNLHVQRGWDLILLLGFSFNLAKDDCFSPSGQEPGGIYGPEGKEGVICSAARPLPWGKDAK